MRINFDRLKQEITRSNQSIDFLYSNCKFCKHPLNYYIRQLPNQIYMINWFNATCPNNDFNVIFHNFCAEYEAGWFISQKCLYFIEKDININKTFLLKLEAIILEEQKLIKVIDYFSKNKHFFKNQLSILNQAIDIPTSSFKDRGKIDQFLMLFS